MERTRVQVQRKAAAGKNRGNSARKPTRAKQNVSVLRAIQTNKPANDTSIQAHNNQTPSIQLQGNVTPIPVSKASDPLEQQADQVADSVLAKTDAPPITSTQEKINRACAECEEEMQGETLQASQNELFRQEDLEEESEELQRQAEDEEEEETIQRQVEEDEEEEMLQRQTEEDEEEEELQRQVEDQEEDEELQLQSQEDDQDEEEIQRLCNDCEDELETAQKQSDSVSVSEPDDPLEKEADRVADQVLRKQADQPPPPLESVDEDEELQRQCEECESEELQLKVHAYDQPNQSASHSQKPGLWTRIKSVFRSGRTLPGQVARFFSSRMGHDFSNVQIHTEKEAGETARAIHARAYTYRNHVVFAPDEFQPHSYAGRHLIAHELTHVVQQGAAPRLTDTAQTATDSSQTNASNHAPQTVAPTLQRDDDEGIGSRIGNAFSAVGNAIGGAVDVGADMIWSAVERVAPRPLMNLIREVQQKGFFGYIREKISEATDSIFSGLSNQSGVIGTILQTFARLAGTATTILVGLAQGNCEPLFAALRQMRDMVTELASDAWNAITDFFRPIGEFFSDLWQRFGAPVVDWLREVAGDTWEFISGLGRQIRDWAQPVINAISTFVGDAWGWVKEQLGIPESTGDSGGGIGDWIQEQAQSAWDAIKRELAPVIEPIQSVIQKVREVLPLDAIVNFRDTVNGWLQQVAETARNMDTGEGGDVAENQDSLRAILPAILESIHNFRNTLVSTGSWVADKIGSAVDTGKQFISAIATSPLVRGLRSAFDWLNTGLDNLGNWARQTVQGLFTSIGNGLVWLSQFIEPVLNALRRIIEVVGDLLGRLPDFLLGPIWWVLPDCIKDPIKNFFIEQILGRIPLFQQLMEAGDIWARVQATALAILRQIFVDGDLMGAAWRFFREMLGLIGIPAQLVVQVIANAAQAISDIIMDPVGFLGNLLRAMWQGATQFFSNILTHLLGGVTGWLFGQIEDAGLTPPDITSFRSIISFVFDLLGLTLENIWRILAQHVGQQMVERIRGAIEFATGAWEFIQVAIDEGLPGVWRMIQERLSDLWSQVLDSVASWINTAIIATASRWLLSLLDATGITPVINSLIAIYRAIESFAQYIVEMLEIVNSVVQGLSDIARGMIQSAADYLENTMADSLPIVIGFLANQFGLGRLGTRVRELVESLRESVNNALDWLIGNAVRLGRSFLDMVRSGVAAVRNWWENRRSFRDTEGHSHQLYFQSEQGDLIVESDPTPVGRFLTGLTISQDDPQRSQKENHKDQAQRKLEEIARIKQDLSRQREGANTSDLQNQLNQKMDELATHLTPLLGGAGDSNGRLPNPLTLATLNDAPVTTPRSSEEEQIDLNGARQVMLLAAETADGSEELASYFDRIRTRFALTEVAYQANGDNYNVKLRATQQQTADVNVAMRGTTPGISVSSQITHNTGTAAGDTVGTSMEADPVGQDKINAGSEPRESALRGVMNKLVTNPSRRSASKYIKGHLLNHNIGGPGDNTNMYPITGAANSAHHSRVESRVKGWVDRHYWIYYSVRVRSITESITESGKHPDNYINSTFHCEAHIKNLDGSERDAFSDDIVSTYTRQDVDGEEVPDASEPLELNGDIRRALNNLSSGSRTTSAISNAVEQYESTASSRVGLGPARIGVMIEAYEASGSLNWENDERRRTALTYVNNRASTIRTILTSPTTTE